MPYIYGADEFDVLRIQGYVMAQDRLFQMHLTRLFSSGRISELAGEKRKKSDIMMRTLGFRRHAVEHAGLLDAHTRKSLSAYRDGINQYIQQAGKTLPLEFKLSGLQVEPWNIEDTLTIMYYMGWGSAANLKTEIVSQMLIKRIGIDRFKEIFPLSTNSDDPGIRKAFLPSGHDKSRFSMDAADLDELFQVFSSDDLQMLKLGSNCWCAGPDISGAGRTVIANDPHLETGMLPGVFYPSCLIYPGMRTVGVTIPGIPGMIIGRNTHVGVGITNSYGDAQDLYVETVDPDNPDCYLEGNRSIPFETCTEEIRIKDKKAASGFRKEPVLIRKTRRGPVISGILPKLTTDRVITVRWAPFEAKKPDLGLFYLLKARSVQEVRTEIEKITFVNLNIITADISGDIGWQTTGLLPIRSDGDGTMPYVVRGTKDNWSGFIPFHEMPSDFDVSGGWIGNANHNTVPSDYPYYVSSYFSPYYRYQRLKELITSSGEKTVDDHWRYQRDTLNVLARELVPVLVKALAQNPDTRAMGGKLEAWNFHDDQDLVGPALYHGIYERLAELVFSDELGPSLCSVMLDTWYFWQERLEQMILQGDSSWFDIITTQDRQETLAELIQQAGREVQERLLKILGRNMDEWTWGKVNRLSLVNPIRRNGIGTRLAGGKVYPMDGSGDTLLRARYPFGRQGSVSISAALRMVIDLGDPDKVLAVLAGGVTGRTFSPYFTDQLDSYMNGDKQYWWFSDEQINAHKSSELIFRPVSRQ